MDTRATRDEEVAERCAKFLDDLDPKSLWKFAQNKVWMDNKDYLAVADYVLSYAAELMRYEFIHKQPANGGDS